MKTGNRGNALLVELLIVVMFFMLASTVLLRMFSAARDQGRQAELMTRALNEAQNVADTLYAAADPEAALESLGFVREGEAWALEGADYTVLATSSVEDREEGRMRAQAVRVTAAGETVCSLPCSRYEEGRP